ncbi:hypothetical protein K504DRAFT_404180 [Pleomassaria siparia CBS 279.74]|uniref:Zn(2)-C6 fungal-type domain-containing protein n=1 Tax=Pleomassaria siparia CBS 279.74 TaxID=1314801 RepID=A0A6G1KEI8_9PLEO|nr:hypothetical protein K504DRAFT_404180 [Pleomassaria siparia CBS 279.74]
MVYHGLLSKGCERCRKRKVKCDERKPTCLRCEKSKALCMGYRKLSDFLFRDESEKVIKKAHRRSAEANSTLMHKDLEIYTSFPDDDRPSFDDENSSPLPLSRPNQYDYCMKDQLHELPRPTSLSQPLEQLGANFFFTKYTSSEAPFAGEYHDWLTSSYASEDPIVYLAIEAVGMAGISNVSYAPAMVSKSAEKYCKALAALKQALSDPGQMMKDTTLMAVILLGMFEMIRFATWDRYEYWKAHIKGAMVLLALRGFQQFSRKRGGLLFILIRSQILTACMHQNIPVPTALLQTSLNFRSSAIRSEWQHQNVASPNSMSDMSFRVIDLRAAIANGEIFDAQIIHAKALEIESDLVSWRWTLPNGWRYDTIRNRSEPEAFMGMGHVYRSRWIAEIWNNWRTLRIVVNQIIIQTQLCLPVSSTSREARARSIIKQLSTDICISTTSFTNTPRVLSLVRPLYLVASEHVNHLDMRRFAASLMQKIGVDMGVQQATLLASTLSAELKEDFVLGSEKYKVPMVPFF